MNQATSDSACGSGCSSRPCWALSADVRSPVASGDPSGCDGPCSPSTPSVLLFATVVPLPLLSPLPAAAVDLPPIASSDLFLQTSGPNAGLGVGDWYTTPASAGGGGQTHLIEITVPNDWPGLPVTVALYDPELETPDPVSPVAVDEIRGDADSATFTLIDPSGTPVASQTYSGGGTNGEWTELATFTPDRTRRVPAHLDDRAMTMTTRGGSG